jgi:hypothetical protein
MNIKIKSIGYNIGTIGYLATGLKSGALKLNEGKMKSTGNHGLWLAGERSEFLGAFNRYALTLRDFVGADEYRPADAAELDPIWTDAARAKLVEIASNWCAEQNQKRKDDVE